MKLRGIHISVAQSKHCCFAKEISDQISESAKVRKTGISKRNVSYIQEKIKASKAVIAIDIVKNKVAGFCYIESWQAKKFVANSGLIVFPEYRNQGLAKLLKGHAFELSRKYFPTAKLFGLTTNPGVMKINSELNYKPVSYQQLTEDEEFWAGCKSCVNYEILSSKNYQHCMCTAMLYDPEKENKVKETKMKVVLAFSGGLDTSYCVKYLMSEEDYEVHTVTVDTGGFTEQELVEIERKAYLLGATTHQNIKATSDFYKQCVKYLIFGNVLKNNTYPLCVSAERAFQALVIANVAKEMQVDAIAHGSTGAGNDQIRFDMMFNVLCPDVKVITPIRDQKLSRVQEQDFLKKHNIPCSEQTAKYSINQGLWGTSVGGCETLTSIAPLPEEAWPTPMTKKSEDTQQIKITFEKGEPIALNDQASSPVAVIKQLQKLAQPYGVGRDIHVGDTIINIKGRVGFEAAAPLILIKAHHTLEKHVLTKAQLKLKEQLANTYGELVHEGQFIEPVLRDIEAYLLSSQKRVCGDVYIELAPWRYQVLGCESKYDLMAAEGSSYGESNENWTADDVKGFSKILGNQLRSYQKITG